MHCRWNPHAHGSDHGENRHKCHHAINWRLPSHYVAGLLDDLIRDHIVLRDTIDLIFQRYLRIYDHPNGHIVIFHNRCRHFGD